MPMPEWCDRHKTYFKDGACPYCVGDAQKDELLRQAMLEAERLDRCERCKFFDKVNDKQGLCRVKSPLMFVIVKDMQTMYETAWPMVDMNDWCGEWKKAQ